MRDPIVDERTSRGDRSESQTLTNSSVPSSPVPHPRVVKGKERAEDLGRVTDGPGPSTGRSGVERTTIDKGVNNVQIREPPNVEHTVIDDSKRGNRDRAPKALTLRQSVRAHLSLQKTEPVKVSRPAAEPESPGPDLRHGRRSLLERISGMEEVPHHQLVSVSAGHLDVSASPDPARTRRSAAAQPERSGADSRNIIIDPTEVDIIDIDNHHPDPISNTIYRDNLTAQAECSDQASRVNPKDVLERTRIRLAKMKNMMVAGIPPTAPTPPPIPLDPSTPAEPGETTPPSSVIAISRNKLLERLENERKRAIGAASGEPEVERVVGNISEDSLKVELRARNQLRTRLVAARADRHVGNLEP